MDDLLKNKKIVIVCLLLVIVGIVLFNLVSEKKNVDYYYENNDNINYLKNYGVNEYIPIYVEEADMVIKYLNDYKNLLISDVEASYNLLNEEYRNKKFGNLDKYKEYVNVHFNSTSIYTMEVESYKVIYVNGYKYFDIYDNNDNHFIFKEKSIMDYEVYLDNYTIKIA